MLNKNIKIIGYDPKAMSSAKKILNDSIEYAEDAYQAVKGADVVAILTEWKDFVNLDWQKISTLVNNRIIIDCRNILNKKQIHDLGFVYHCIGRKS